MDFLLEGIKAISWQQVVMYGVGILLIFLAIAKKMEPTLLLPMGLGAIIVNIPFSGAINQMGEDGIVVAGAIEWLFEVGIEASEILPLLLFIGIGAMLDFGPLLSNPKLIFIGAAAQAGIFITIIFSTMFGFDIRRSNEVIPEILGATFRIRTENISTIFIQNRRTIRTHRR